MHNKRADNHGGPASDVEYWDNFTPFPTYWAPDPPTVLEEGCREWDREFLTHLGSFQWCRWLNGDNFEKKKVWNCGGTEIRLN